MDFSLTAEQGAIRDTIRRFVARECPRDAARALDAQAASPAGLLRRLAETGFCGLNCPEAYGGGGRNLLASAMVVEELATMAPVLAGAYASVAVLGGASLAELGSADQQQQWLPALCAGQLLFTIALHESPVATAGLEVEMAAVRDAGSFVLDGVKCAVPFASQAQLLLALARTAGGLAFFLVPIPTPGVSVAEVPQIGFRGGGTARVTFAGARLAAAQVLGGPECASRGAEQWAWIGGLEQIASAALALGVARGAYDYAAQYAGVRVQFGQPIVRFEAIQHLLVDLAIEIEAVRLLLYQACWRADTGQPFRLAAAMARARAVPLARRAALQGLHILGGYGFMLEYDAQRYVRDSLALLGGSEPVEVLRNEIGALLGLAGDTAQAQARAL
jgi:alkylation response protein AidB-like acyl-CoA dehydrogenase